MPQIPPQTQPERCYYLFLLESEMSFLQGILSNLDDYQDSQDPRVQYLSGILSDVRNRDTRRVTPTFHDVCAQVMQHWTHRLGEYEGGDRPSENR